MVHGIEIPEKLRKIGKNPVGFANQPTRFPPKCPKTYIKLVFTTFQRNPENCGGNTVDSSADFSDCDFVNRFK
jgi:hypothetical protein